MHNSWYGIVPLSIAGNSSVRYEVGIFRKKGTAKSDLAVAVGYFVHVFVEQSEKNRERISSCPIPARIRSALKALHAISKL